jgi:hypothetical protein
MCVQEHVTYIETEAVTSEKWTCYNYDVLIHSSNHICGVKVNVLASSSNSGRVNSKTIKLVFVASMSNSREEFEDTKGQRK